MRNLFIVSFVWLTSVVAFCAPTPVKIAILAGEGQRAPKAGLVDLLTVEMSKREQVVLLERTEIRKVLTEQGLSALSTGDTGTVIQLGELLETDLFVFIEKVAGVNIRAIRVRIIEARTGVMLTDELQDGRARHWDLTALGESFDLALEKWATVEKDRRYVAFLDFVSEDLGGQSGEIPDVLGELLLDDLSRSPSVILLDREHLDRLTQERELTGVESRLKAAAILLEGGVKL
jgi:hypothetical protein